MTRSAGDRVMTRVVNPVVRRVVASPAHDVLGEHVAVIGLTGRRSGRSIEVPVNAIPENGGLVVLSRRDRRWWRNLRGGAPVRVVLDGRRMSGRAAVDRDVAQEAVAGFVARASAQSGHPITPERAAAMAHDRVVVRIHVDGAAPSRPPLRGRALWRRWTATVTVGETLAFAVPALTGALLAAADAPWPAVVLATLLAGAAEGTVLGFAQALVIRRAIPAIATRTWIRATVAGALVAWSIGLLPVVAGDALGALPTGVQAALVTVLGAALVSAMGAFQWRVLRRHRSGASLWVPATAAAWLLGLVAFMAIATPLWHEGQAAVLVVAVGVAAGAVMAFTVAAISGLALARVAA